MRFGRRTKNVLGLLEAFFFLFVIMFNCLNHSVMTVTPFDIVVEKERHILSNCFFIALQLW